MLQINLKTLDSIADHNRMSGLNSSDGYIDVDVITSAVYRLLLF